jgi:AraC-like DNA-binding protein
MQPTLLRIAPSFRGHDPLQNCHYFLTRVRVECISNTLQRFMRDEKPFLRTGYCIRDLADEIDIPAYQLSAYINQFLGLNFNEFFNWFRIRHCQDLMQTGLIDRFNLRGLANRCGFNNRNTLTTAFKKFTGLTPSAYSRVATEKGGPAASAANTILEMRFVNKIQNCI